MRIYKFAAFSVGLFALLCESAAVAEPRNSDGLPSASFSVAPDYSAGTLRDGGPLFSKALAIFKLAEEGRDEEFAKRLTSDADVTLNKSANEKTPFDAEIVRAAAKSCLGPFPYDEGSSWVQFSWVCRDDAAAPITQFVTADSSPELIVSVWFAGDQINRIRAMEPVPWPGQRTFRLGSVPATWTPK